MYFRRLVDLREDHDKTQIEIAAYLNMNEKEFGKLINSEPEKTFGDTEAWHARDGRIVMKFKKHYSSKDDYLYFEK